MEFSKKLLFTSSVVTLVLTVMCIWFSVAGLSLEGLSIVTPLAWVETGTATGYYYWKAKNENRAKYAQTFVRDFAKDCDTETALRMAEIVLKD